MQIIPSILEKDFSIAENKIKLIKDKFRWMQIDVIDGFFSEGKSFELELLNKIEVQIQNNLIEVHLMVKEPIKWIEKCNFIGASRIIGQVEMMNDRNSFIQEVKNMGLEAGLAFDVDTEIEKIPDGTDVVLIMGRKSGFQANEFQEDTINKIKKVVQAREGKDAQYYKIGIDGGVNLDTIKKIKEAGADIAYCGRTVFDAILNDNLEKLDYAINN